MPWWMIPAIAGGLLGSAFGKSGKQGGQQQTGETSSTGTTSTKFGQDTRFGQTSSSDLFRQLLEPGAFGEAREKALLPTLLKNLTSAQQPVFGPAQQAQFIEQANRLSQDAMENIKQGLASSGALDSGRLNQALTDVNLGRAGQISSFFGQLPFAEAEAKQQRMSSAIEPLLQLLGRVPLSEKTTGKTDTEGTQATTGEQFTESQTKQVFKTLSEMFGPGFLKALLSLGGGLLGDVAGTGLKQAGLTSKPGNIFS